MSHTQGPWEYQYDNDIGPNDEGVGEVYTVSSNHEIIARVENEDDARLMAASPNLLKALESVLTATEFAIDDMTGSYYLSDDERNYARSAIEKAKGATK